MPTEEQVRQLWRRAGQAQRPDKGADGVGPGLSTGCRVMPSQKRHMIRDALRQESVCAGGGGRGLREGSRKISWKPISVSGTRG